MLYEKLGVCCDGNCIKIGRHWSKVCLKLKYSCLMVVEIQTNFVFLFLLSTYLSIIFFKKIESVPQLI